MSETNTLTFKEWMNAVDKKLRSVKAGAGLEHIKKRGPEIYEKAVHLHRKTNELYSCFLGATTYFKEHILDSFVNNAPEPTFTELDLKFFINVNVTLSFGNMKELRAKMIEHKKLEEQFDQYVKGTEQGTDHDCLRLMECALLLCHYCNSASCVCMLFANDLQTVMREEQLSLIIDNMDNRRGRIKMLEQALIKVQ